MKYEQSNTQKAPEPIVLFPVRPDSWIMTFLGCLGTDEDLGGRRERDNPLKRLRAYFDSIKADYRVIIQVFQGMGS